MLTYSWKIRKEPRQKIGLGWCKGVLTSWSDVSFLECELNSCPVKRWNEIGYKLFIIYINNNKNSTIKEKALGTQWVWVWILTSLLWRVRQSLHSYEPKWFFIKYGSLLMSMVSRANWRSRSRLSRLLSEVEATPPLPVLPPARCWKSIFAGFFSNTHKYSKAQSAK